MGRDWYSLVTVDKLGAIAVGGRESLSESISGEVRLEC